LTQNGSGDFYRQRCNVYKFKYLAAYFRDVDNWQAVGLDMLTNKVFFIEGHLSDWRLKVYPLYSGN